MVFENNTRHSNFHFSFPLAAKLKDKIIFSFQVFCYV